MSTENKTDTNLNSITDFFLELDALKHIERRSFIIGGKRRENSAEHSWHLAMACWSISEHFNLQLNMEILLKLALGSDDLSEPPLLEAIFLSNKAEMLRCSRSK